MNIQLKKLRVDIRYYYRKMTQDRLSIVQFMYIQNEYKKAQYQHKLALGGIYYEYAYYKYEHQNITTKTK